MEKKAVFVFAENYIGKAEQLGLEDKLDRIQHLASLHDTAKCGAHILLTFGPQDKLSDANAAMMAKRYMEAAGFGDQPYLVYRHYDAWQPHIHIVSTTIRVDRSVITLAPYDLKKLNVLTQNFEKEFSLTPNLAASIEGKNAFQVKHAQQVVYAQSGLKHAISDVLNTVIGHYNYTSLDELNVILRQYNVKADRGAEGTRMYQNRGLIYAAVNEEGHQISRGLRASTFGVNARLSDLEQKFVLNEAIREKLRERVVGAIEWTLAVDAPGWEGFKQSLGEEGIHVAIQEAKDDNAPEVYFVDHRDKSVFSGEGLGIGYNLQALKERCAQEEKLQDEETLRQHQRLHL